MEDLTNQFIGGYHFQWRIASGGMATVYVGQRTDDPSGPQVALKVLHPQMAANATVRKRFSREAEIGQRLKHRNIIQVFDLVEDKGYIFMVMQYLTEGTLSERIQTKGNLSWSEALYVHKQIGRALDYAHSQGIIHRDVKPSNILFDQYGDAHLSDFGVAHEVDANTLTGTGFQPGTVTYMSPEQIQGKTVTAASDQFSLAVVFYRMLAGTSPFKGTTATAISYQIVNKSPQKLPRRQDVPQSAQKILERAMSKNPEARYPTIAKFTKALEQIQFTNAGSSWSKNSLIILVLALLVGGGGLAANKVFMSKKNNQAPTHQSTGIPEKSVPSPPPGPTMISTTTPTHSPSETGGGVSTTDTNPDSAVIQEENQGISPESPSSADIAIPTAITAPTATPSYTPADSAIPTAITAPTTTPTFTPAPTKPSKKTTSPTPTPSAQNFAISLLQPDEGFAGDGMTLAWQSTPLENGQSFEPVVWKTGSPDEMKLNGMSPTGPGVTSTSIPVTISLLNNIPPLNIHSGYEYYWGVCIFNNNTKERLYCSEGRKFRYEKAGGGDSAGGGGAPTPSAPPGGE